MSGQARYLHPRHDVGQWATVVRSINAFGRQLRRLAPPSHGMRLFHSPCNVDAAEFEIVSIHRQKRPGGLSKHPRASSGTVASTIRTPTMASRAI
jgi:hypothetical protein